MKHETVHELLALRLYDELSVDEGVLVERHLEDCADCRAFASSLADGLGALARADGGRQRDELPVGWSDRLEGMTSASPRRVPRSLATFAAGLAAGLLLMWFATSQTPPEAPKLARQGPEFVMRSTPPPRTTSGGSLAQLPLLLER